MITLWTYMKEAWEEHARFFKEAATGIAEDNLRMALDACVRTIVILILFLLTTPLIIRGWTPSRYHILFLPASVSCLLLCLWGRERKLREKGSTAICIFYIFVSFLFLFLIDTLGTPENPACFIPVIYMGILPLFALPLWFSYTFIFFVETLFVVTVHAMKPVSVAQYDIFISLVGAGCSVALLNLMLSLRLKAYWKQVEYKRMSEQDALSGIYNKRGGMAAAAQYVAENNPKTTCTLLIIDLDDFKNVNDTKGHQAGDLLLGCVGELLRKEFRSSDIIVRFGGDEFVILLKNSASGAMAENKAKKIQAALRQRSMELLGSPVTCSIGIGLAEKAEVDFENFFQQVDTALYDAKGEDGKGHTVIRNYKKP